MQKTRGKRGTITTPDAEEATVRELHMPPDARALLESIGDRASRVKVWRWNDERGKYAFLQVIDAGIFSEEEISRRFGGGQYRGDILDGGNKYVAAIPPFDIDATASPTLAPAAMTAPVVTPRPLTETVREWAGAIAAGVAAVVPLFTLIAKRSGDGTDPVALLQVVQQAEERGERRGREFGKLEAEAPAGGRTMADVAAENLPELIGLVRESRRAPAPAPAPVATASIAPPAPSPAPSPMPTLPAGFEWLHELRPFVPQLVKAAADGMDDADAIATYAVARMPDALLGKIARVVETPDFDAVVMAALPEIARRDWLAEFVATVRALVQVDPLEA